MRLSIRYKRAEEVFGILLAKYKVKEFPYHKVKLPQEEGNLPTTMPRGGREEGLFWFAVCYYMRLTESVGAVRKMAKFYDAYPAYFFPETFEKAVAEHGELVDQLIAFGLTFQCRDVSKSWTKNSSKLAAHWNGDPRNLFKGITTYNGLCRRMIFGTQRRTNGRRASKTGPYGFSGFRYKMVSMLMYFYIKRSIVAPLMHPVPVDFHVMRILLSSEIVVLDDPSRQMPEYQKNKVEAAGRTVTLWYCKEHNVDPTDLCDVLWYLSRTYCKGQIGNRSDEGPGRGRKTVVEPLPIEWTPARIARHERTCAYCPIESTCRYNIPVATYTRKGLLVLRGERPQPPGKQHRLGFYLEHFAPERSAQPQRARPKAETTSTSSQKDLFEAPS